MTTYATHRARIAKGLPVLGVLLAGVLAGCAADPAPSAEGVVQQDLRRHGHFDFCGGSRDKECGADEVCLPFFSKSCPGPGHAGLCVPRPQHCNQSSEPVCGCDGSTYDSMCEAAQAGAAVAHRGACEAPACGDHGKASCPGAGSCVDAHAADHDDHHLFGFWGDHDDRDHEKVCVCNVTKHCAAGQAWNDDPAVCACVAIDPCAGVVCRAGEQCVAQPDGTGVCQASGCTGVTCRSGEVCAVQSDGSGLCIPDPCAGVVCRAGQTCVAQPDGTALCQ